MNKVLSVCIPSYNMEGYLKRNLDSFVAASEVLDKVEIIIVNDGSQDRTLEIANSYKSRFPNSIVVVNKANGHYGSCVNVSLKIASGKYFRIVDGDDWVDTNALVYVIKELERVNADIIYTKYSSFHEISNNTTIEEDAADFKWRQELSLNDVRFEKYLHMHQLTYRLDLLKRINYRQTEGVCYTDTEYDFIPCVNAKTIYCIPVSLYQYFVGRDDQSMAPKVISNNFLHLYKVLDSIVNYPKPLGAHANYEFLRKCYVDALLGYMVDAVFVKRCENQEWNRLLREMLTKLQFQEYDLSEFWQRKFWGCPWIRLLYKNDMFSCLRLKLLFSLLKLRLSFKD